MLPFRGVCFNHLILCFKLRNNRHLSIFISPFSTLSFFQKKFYVDKKSYESRIESLLGLKENIPTSVENTEKNDKIKELPSRIPSSNLQQLHHFYCKCGQVSSATEMLKKIAENSLGNELSTSIENHIFTFIKNYQPSASSLSNVFCFSYILFCFVQISCRYGTLSRVVVFLFHKMLIIKLLRLLLLPEIWILHLRLLI